MLFNDIFEICINLLKLKHENITHLRFYLELFN